MTTTNMPSKTGGVKILSALLAMIGILSGYSAGQTPVTVTTLLNFNNTNGAYSFASVAIGSGGVVYGTALDGGANGDGVVFQVTPPAAPGDSWIPSVIYNFKGPKGDGSNPYAGLIIDGNGSLYGTTTRGGALGRGTVFELATPASPGGPWREEILYSFGSGGAADGAYPYSGLSSDSTGTLYGTTVSGGAAGLGTAFALTPPAVSGGAWTETVLYSFGSGGDGASPYAALAVGKSGRLYGTTPYGGAFGSGTVFVLPPPLSQGGSWTETILHSFAG